MIGNISLLMAKTLRQGVKNFPVIVMSFPDFTRHFLLLLSETVDSFFYAILIQ